MQSCSKEFVLKNSKPKMSRMDILLLHVLSSFLSVTRDPVGLDAGEEEGDMVVIVEEEEALEMEEEEEEEASCKEALIRTTSQ
jgi:hypothetical protein